MKKLNLFKIKNELSFKSLRMLSVCGFAMTFLATSCSNDSMSENEVQEPSAKTEKFQLLKNSDELSYIDGSEGSANLYRATKAPGDDKGRFNITLKFLVDVTERQEEVFNAAAARWERIIIKDVSSITGNIPSAFQGFPPASTGTLDDIVIEVAIAPIDGPGNILGQAGPRYVRISNGLPLAGVMFFDVADLDLLEAFDLFEEVIVHEMGHVLGVGTLWNYGGKALRQGPASNPYFAGEKANVFWNAEGGLYELPIENMGGPGTAGGHWRESVLRNELMTGFINLGENPLSRITAGSMSDLGYGSASVGEQYDLPKDSPGVDINEMAKNAEGIDIGSMELLLEPIGVFMDE